MTFDFPSFPIISHNFPLLDQFFPVLPTYSHIFPQFPVSSRYRYDACVRLPLLRNTGWDGGDGLGRPVGRLKHHRSLMFMSLGTTGRLIYPPAGGRKEFRVPAG